LTPRVKNVVDKYTKFFKPNEKFSGMVTVLLYTTTSESYGS